MKSGRWDFVWGAALGATLAVLIALRVFLPAERATADAQAVHGRAVAERIDASGTEGFSDVRAGSGALVYRLAPDGHDGEVCYVLLGPGLRSGISCFRADTTTDCDMQTWSCAQWGIPGEVKP